jgi:hypothetical protein
MEYRGKQYSVILTIGAKWKWSARWGRFLFCESPPRNTPGIDSWTVPGLWFHVVIFCASRWRANMPQPSSGISQKPLDCIPMQNALLAGMEGSLLSTLEPFFSVLSVPSGTVVHDVGNEVDRVYFPTSGFASLQFVVRGGRAIDTALIGRDGALGLMAGLGRYEARDRCVARDRAGLMKLAHVANG